MFGAIRCELLDARLILPVALTSHLECTKRCLMKLGIVIDCGSLWYGAPRALPGEAKKRVNYAKLLALLQDGLEDTTVEVTAYVVARAGVDVVGFQFALEEMGYMVKLTVDRVSAREEIAKDILQSAILKKWTRLAIASEDAMLYGTLQALKDLGIEVHWWAFKTPFADHKLHSSVLEVS